MVSITQTYLVIKLCPLSLFIILSFFCKGTTRVRQSVAEVYGFCILSVNFVLGPVQGLLLTYIFVLSTAKLQKSLEWRKISPPKSWEERAKPFRNNEQLRYHSIDLNCTKAQAVFARNGSLMIGFIWVHQGGPESGRPWRTLCQHKRSQHLSRNQRSSPQPPS